MTWPPASTRLIVSVTASAGIAAPVAPQAAMAREISAAEQNGRAASWTSTMSGARAASASRPGRTEACRVAPPSTGGSSLKPLAAAS